VPGGDAIRKTKTALSAIEGQLKARAGLASGRNEAAGVSLSTESRRIETEAAPIRYVAELLGTDTNGERAIRSLNALMLLCCDPLAIALAGRGFGRR
jgi:hypothetical protein